VSDPLESGLALLAELRRMQLRALTLVHRARAARVRVLKSINEKAPGATGAEKGDQP
jgi:hypothetical protein